MCSEHFVEGPAKKICLPEDRPELIGRILEHLYGDDKAALMVEPTKDDSEDRARETAHTLLALYAVAERYQLPSLQVLLGQRLLEDELLRNDGIAFFQIVADHFSDIPLSSTAFRDFFQARSREHLCSMSENDLNESLAVMLDAGGLFAVEVFKQLVFVHWKGSGGSQKVLANLQQKLDSTTSNCSSTSESLWKAKRMHRSQHPSCGQCHVLL